jgi:chromosomal replication initiation ATPase DnaA
MNPGLIGPDSSWQNVYENLKRAHLLHLVDQVSVTFCIPIHLLLSRRRTKTVALARRALYRELRMLGYSLPEIGLILGPRPHDRPVRTSRAR